MTLEDLAKVVADDFKATMLDEGFNSFAEMARCYAWDSADIKDEVNAIIGSVDAYIDEVDGTEVIFDDDMISYRKFSAMWHALLK